MPLRIKIIIGSTRQGRFGDRPAGWIFEETKMLDGVETELLDLRDYPMPFLDDPKSPAMEGGNYPDEAVRGWAEKIKEADAYIIVAPEYNHGYSAVLKNAMDHLYGEWNNKPVGFVSYGGVGGARAVEQLREVAIEFQMAPIRNAIHIQAPWGLVDDKGDLKVGAFDSLKNSKEKFLTQLLWWAKALKAAREDKS